MMMNEEQFRQINQRLETITKLIAGFLLKDAENKTQKIEILEQLEIPTKDIAQLVGTTEKSVKTIKQRIRKKAKNADCKPLGGEKSGAD
jgi:predicted regulator of amino acid metabolism with ACT domain